MKARLFITILLVFTLTGCQYFGGEDEDVVPLSKESSSIEPFEGPMSPVISDVYTTKKQLALTFNGLGNAETMDKLLNELDTYQIKATFFVPGMRVAEEPDLAQEIVARGHELENNTLNHLDMSNFNYEQIYNEISLSNQVIQQQTGVTPPIYKDEIG